MSKPQSNLVFSTADEIAFIDKLGTGKNFTGGRMVSFTRLGALLNYAEVLRNKIGWGHIDREVAISYLIESLRKEYRKLGIDTARPERLFPDLEEKWQREARQSNG
jgi:hypothetical protein